MNKYKCETHKLDLCCLGCVKAWIARHDAMLKFIKKLAEQKTLSPANMWYMQKDAKKLLKDIGQSE